MILKIIQLVGLFEIATVSNLEGTTLLVFRRYFRLKGKNGREKLTRENWIVGNKLFEIAKTLCLEYNEVLMWRSLWK